MRVVENPTDKRMKESMMSNRKLVKAEIRHDYKGIIVSKQEAVLESQDDMKRQSRIVSNQYTHAEG